MGTPDFAVASLDALLKAGCHIAGIVTAPDKPAGRGMKISESAVKKYAVAQGLPLLQPVKLKNQGFIESLRAWQADLQVVVAFRMLPEIIWHMPPMGTINLHGSLLPQYRGAAPINHAVMNGEKMTGVTTFKLKHEIDTGNILLQESFKIGEDETAGDVHDRMKVIGARLLVKTVQGLAAGTLKEIPQEIPASGQLHGAPRIFTEDCRIDWTKNCSAIYNQIRGLSPQPGAFTILNGKLLKIFASRKDIQIVSLSPGKWVTDGKCFLKFACADGYIEVLEVQLEGKKRMPVTEFLRGFRVDSSLPAN